MHFIMAVSMFVLSDIARIEPLNAKIDERMKLHMKPTLHIKCMYTRFYKTETIHMYEYGN